ncbi:hypothetical protein Lal_00032552 [Lupinus albus]|nr:hypothetical protein Lal_00032552 [Lupinus albus]
MICHHQELHHDFDEDKRLKLKDNGHFNNNITRLTCEVSRRRKERNLGEIIGCGQGPREFLLGYLVRSDWESLEARSKRSLEENAIPIDQTQASQIDEAPNIPQESYLCLPHLDAMEQRLNERIDNRMQEMEDRLMVEFQRQESTNNTSFETLRFLFRTLGDFSQPPPSS